MHEYAVTVLRVVDGDTLDVSIDLGFRMATLFRCDQCHYYQETPLPFEVTQITQELDEDSEPIVMAYDLCSPGCLSDFAMGLSLDFPDEGEP